MLPVTKKIIPSYFNFSFYLVESRYKIIGKNRLNFKTLTFSNKRKNLHNFGDCSHITSSRKGEGDSGKCLCLIMGEGEGGIDMME